MKEVLLLYNPMAGVREFNQMLDYSIDTFQKAGYGLRILRTRSQHDFYDYLDRQDMEQYAAVLVAGGDGSVSLALNGLLGQTHRVPLGIIPSGTSNDFAQYLGITENLKVAVTRLARMRRKWIDTGTINDRHFINVCGGGLLPNIASRVDQDMKNMIGKAAYYLTGVAELPRYRTFRLRVTVDDRCYEEEYYMYLVMNGRIAGGFTKIGGPASAEDGLLDFVGIKMGPFAELPYVFSMILRGEHVHDRRFRYEQGRHFRIEYLSGDPRTEEVDVDGEPGPEYPLDIRVRPRNLEVLY